MTDVRLEIAIQASTKEVWRALIQDIHIWWRKDFYASETSKRFMLEPKLGGRMYEDDGDGAGVVWYTVTGVEPGRRLLLVGHIFPGFGGPATSFLALELENAGKKTVLRISDSTLGAKASPAEKESGWKMLFEDGLKAHVEGERAG